MSFTSKQLRKKYLDFFKSQNHEEVASSSTIPDENDQTVLFTTAGMQQFVPNLMGKPHPQGTKLISVQKCVRTVDIDDVGDNRHLTFFEMLGNWSLGDYFKEEAIEWSYKFLIDELKIDKEKLWVTVYGGDETIPFDEEAAKIWEKWGIPRERIVGIGAPTDPEKRRRKGRGDNFWGPAGPTGPCGPSTEMFIWLGEGQPVPGQTPETDEDNFIEVWNDVFMEFNMDENKEVTPLAQKNVDTGMGLERLTMIMQNKTTVFETDVYDGIIAEIEKISGKKYPPYSGDLDENNPITRAFRVIADHVRCSAHLIADGVAPSNEGRGYVLRRLLRRAVRYGKNLGIQSFLEKIAAVYIAEYSEFYGELSDRKNVITDALKIEEENFLRTLEKGEKKLEEMMKGFPQKLSKGIEKFEKGVGKVVEGIKKVDRFLNGGFSGKDAFLLSDTYGFPKDLTRELAQEKGFEIDEEQFNAEFEEELKAQRERSRANANFERKGQENEVFDDLPATKFVGDTGQNLEIEAKILKFVDDGEGKMRVAFEQTPFYAESGGQVGDRGTIQVGEKIGKIVDTKKLPNGVFVHYISAPECVNCQCLKMDMSGKVAKISVDKNLRDRTTRHHSAAHLLQSALMEVLGDHIEQAGSLVDENRTRFDFSHPKAMSAKEIRAVEQKISEYVTASYAVEVKEMTMDEAKAAGAIALFSEKYGDTVRTVKMGEPSFELCGGTHITNTSEIGGVKIISESSVASGIRRIEMVVGQAAQEFFLEKNAILEKVSEKLKTPSSRLEERVEKLTTDLKISEKTVQDLEAKLLGYEAEEFLVRASETNGKKIICEPVPEHDLKKVAGMARALSAKGIDIVAMFTEDGGVAIATQKGGVDAREIFAKVKEFAGGNGGGSPFFVQGKGVELENFGEIREIVENFGG
jgi:alanyl-tRNA synthetase